MFRRARVGRAHYARGAPQLTSLSILTSTPRLDRASNKGRAAITSSSETITRLSYGQYERFWTDEAGPQTLRSAFIAFFGAYDKITTIERDTLRSFGHNVGQTIEDFVAAEQATRDELKALHELMGDPSTYTSPTPTSSTNPSSSPAGGSASSIGPATTVGASDAPTQDAQIDL